MPNILHSENKTNRQKKQMDFTQNRDYVVTIYQKCGQKVNFHGAANAVLVFNLLFDSTNREKT